MRLAASVDNPEYKNSIITFMKIDEKEWKRVIKKYFTNQNKYVTIYIQYSCGIRGGGVRTIHTPMVPTRGNPERRRRSVRLPNIHSCKGLA